MTDNFKKDFSSFKFNLKAFLIIFVAIVLVSSVIAFYLVRFSPEKEEADEQSTTTLSEKMESGEEGEIEEGKTLEEVNPEAVTSPVRSPGTAMPSAVFNTKGEIIELRSDSILVKGSGENFEDQKSRTLTVKITEETIVFEKRQESRYEGLEGLEYLNEGEEILISSSGNIRGKTEFEAGYINKI
jgi:hypothetical protein